VSFRWNQLLPRRSRDVVGRRHRALAIEPLEDRRMLAFAHPGLLHTEADFDRMADKVAASAQPWLAGWNSLTSHGYSQLGVAPRPLETVIRGGTGQNFNQMVIDIQRAYQLALRWKVSGDTRYADQAVVYLNAWSATMTSLTGNADRFLAAGIYGYEWANVAEIMRTYSGWAPADVTRFQNWLLDEYLPLNRQFLASHNDAAITNYWANWDLCNMNAILAIGVFCDRQDIYDEALDYFHNGPGNGGDGRFVYYVHDGNLGQWQEAGRDQGHTVFGVSLVGPFMQMAWNQGDDLFSYDNNRFLAGAEYVAKYNLGNDVPFEQYSWGTGQSGTWQTQTVVSGAGRGNNAPGYELVYNHYVNIKGIAAPYSEERADALGPEGGSGNGDQFGFGTLTYTLDPLAPGISKPSGLTARREGEAVRLNWWGAVDADTYNVYRASTVDGSYTQIAANISDLLTYADFAAAPGDNFYKVTGVVGNVETGPSNIVQLSGVPELLVHLPFNETSGSVAADSSGNGSEGTLVGGGSWTAGKTGNAVALSGAAQYVALPANLMADVADFTVAAWVNVSTTANWMRIFDFGDAQGHYMYLTPRSGAGVARFAIATNYGYNEQAITAPALPIGQWTHVAVTMSDNVLKLYVNGVAVGSITTASLAPFQLGTSDQNWIGRSQYPADPYFNGRIDDFRIYKGALAPGELYQMATGNVPPAVPAAPASLTATAVVGNQINLSWPNAGGGLTYTLRRATQSGGRYTTIATRATATTFADANRVAGQTYYYIVTADNAGGSSLPSPQASATALPTLPGLPTALKATNISDDTIALTWTAANYATSYTIHRATAPSGPFATIASGVADAQYTDAELATGSTYYYTVTAVNASGTSASSNAAFAVASSERARWAFNETAGTFAADSSGNALSATLVNGPVWTTGRIENALTLDGVDDHATLPAGIVNGLTDVTIATWVNLDVVTSWTRIFDIGSSTSSSMFLTPRNGANNFVRFAITTTGGGGEQQINTTRTISPGVWYHVAVTLSGNVGILYVNGVEAGRNSAMTLNPTSLGATTQNYLGKSQYNDPYLDGRLDDFRIYNRAITAAEVSQLTYVPTTSGDYDLDGVVTGNDFLAWQRNLGQSPAPYQQADGDGNGRVNSADLDVWRRSLGTPALAATLAESAIAVRSADDDLTQELSASISNRDATDAALASMGAEATRGPSPRRFWFLTTGLDELPDGSRAASKLRLKDASLWRGLRR
jgi:fibronectin type 3 domain-containing protein